MASSGVTIDSVSIDIETTAGKSVTGIESLAAALDGLKSATKGGSSNLQKLAENLTSLGNAAQSLNVNISSVQNLTKIIEPLSQLKDIPNARGLGQVVSNLEKLPATMDKLSNPAVIENVTRVSTQLGEALTPLATKMAAIGDGFSKMQALADKYGVSVTKASSGTKKSSAIFSTLKSTLSGAISLFKRNKASSESFAKSAARGIQSLTSKIKQMSLALIGTRTVFTMLRKAASEYENFDTSLQKFSTNVWRAFGAQLAPVIEYAMNLFKQFVRVIYSVVKALTGIDLIARANARALASETSSAKSLADELGNLQKFDDLNVVEFNEDSGSGSDDLGLIELEEIDLTPIQKIVDWAKKFKDTILEALDTGGWYDVGVVLAEGINEGLNAINFDTIKNGIEGVTSKAIDAFNGFVNELDFNLVGDKLSTAMITVLDIISDSILSIDWSALGEGINNFFAGYRLEDLTTAVFNAIQSGFKGIGTMLEQIDWAMVGEKISGAIHNAIVGIGNIWDTIDWGKIGESIRDVLINIDWKEIGTAIINAIGEVFSGASDLLGGLLDIDSGDAEVMLGAASAIGLLVVAFIKLKSLKGGTKDISEGLNSMTKGFGDFFKSIGQAAEIISILGGLALVLNSLSTLMQTMSDTGTTWQEFGTILAEAIGAIAIGFTSLAAATKLLDIQSLFSVLAIFTGMVATLLSLNELIKTINGLGENSSTVFAGLAGILVGFEVLLWSIVAAALVLGSNPLALIAVVVLFAGLSATLLVMANTLPTILDAVGDFIVQVAPSLNMLLDTIMGHIENIISIVAKVITKVIDALSDALPTIINACKSIWEGIKNVFSSVGKFFEDTFTKAWEGVKKVFSTGGKIFAGITDGIVSAFKTIVNAIIGGINNVIAVPFNAINSVLTKIKDTSIMGLKPFKDLIHTISVPKIPKLETGTNEIPNEGLYHLHPGEAVVPKKYNPALGNGTSEETNQRLDTLISIMRDMDFTTVVNVGNKQLYKEQQSYNKRQENKYGTLSANN